MTARSLIKGTPPEYLFSDYNQMRRWLRMPVETVRLVYIGPDGSWWDLAGRYKGRQGVKLAKELHGAYLEQFTQLFTEGAYQVGATYERTNIDKRVINLGVVLGYNRSSTAYWNIESHWWDAWPIDTPGWLGLQIPGRGMRWTQVILAKPVDTSMPIDPTAFGNNGFTWDMQIVAPRSYYAKPMLYEQWTAHPETQGLLGYDETTFHIANRGTVGAWPKMIYSGPGQCWMQDGMLNTMIRLPVLSSDDGYVLVDTDPAERTFTAATDPIDNIFYQFIRQSRVLDFFLHDIDALGLPVWRRANGVRFQSPIPPRTVANIKVRHDTPGAQVTLFIPQRYGRAG